MDHYARAHKKRYDPPYRVRRVRRDPDSDARAPGHCGAHAATADAALEAAADLSPVGDLGKDPSLVGPQECAERAAALSVGVDQRWREGPVDRHGQIERKRSLRLAYDAPARAAAPSFAAMPISSGGKPLSWRAWAATGYPAPSI